MSTKHIKGVIVPRHDTAEKWARATNFVPRKGELIVYDADTTTYDKTVTINGQSYSVKSSDKVRFKFGDGVPDDSGVIIGTNVNALPFVTSDADVGMKTSEGGEIFNLYTDTEVNRTVTFTLPDWLGGGVKTLDVAIKLPKNKAGLYSTARGVSTAAETEGSSAEGTNTIALGAASHVEGKGLSFDINVTEISGTTLTVSVDEASLPELLHPDDFALSIDLPVFGEQGFTNKQVLKVAMLSAISKNTLLWYAGESATVRAYIVQSSEVNAAAQTCSITLASAPEFSTSSKLTVFMGAALSPVSHVEGDYCIAADLSALSLGLSESNNQRQHAEGSRTLSTGYASHSEGELTTASGNMAHAQGQNTTAEGTCSFAGGADTLASGYSSVALGTGSTAKNNNAVAIGEFCHAYSKDSFAGGHNAQVRGESALAFGIDAKALQSCSIALGYSAEANAENAFAVGFNTTASGKHSLAGGLSSTAASHYSLAFGSNAQTQADGAVAFGTDTTASGGNSLAVGKGTSAVNQGCAAFGSNTIAGATNMFNAVAFGDNTQSLHKNSFVTGEYNKSSMDNCLVIGRYNAPQSGDLFEIGAGDSDASRKTVFRVQYGGKVYGGTHCTDSDNDFVLTTKGYMKTYLDNTYSFRVKWTDSSWEGTKFTNKFGRSAAATGAWSIAGGYYSQAQSEASMAFNRNTLVTSDHANATALGFYTQSSTAHCLVAGKYNDYTTGGLFQVGNGSSSARSNAFEVTNSGKAKVGTATTDDDSDLTLVTKGYLNSKASGVIRTFSSSEVESDDTVLDNLPEGTIVFIYEY